MFFYYFFQRIHEKYKVNRIGAVMFEFWFFMPYERYRSWFTDMDYSIDWIVKNRGEDYLLEFLVTTRWGS